MKNWILTFALLVTTAATAQTENKKSGWVLVYENDENGKRISGNIQDLITQIKSGQPIRIGWTVAHPTDRRIRAEHIADAKFITVLGDSTVFTQIDPIVGQIPSFKDRSMTFKENVEWVFSASTTGENDSMNSDVVTKQIIDHKKFRAGVRWYAPAED